MMIYAIKNFSKFQHFKDRTPPWIKLYRDILDDPDWHDLQAEAAKVLVMLWVIASEDETKRGMLPEEKKLAFRLRLSEKNLRIILSQLKNFLIQVDINAISKRYQDVSVADESQTATDTPRYQLDAPERAGEETETETETEGERETESHAPKEPARFDFLTALIESGVERLVATDYIALRKAKKCVQTATAFKAVSTEASKANLTVPEAVAICCRRNWGGFEASWIKPEDRPTTSEPPKVFDMNAWTRKLMA